MSNMRIDGVTYWSLHCLTSMKNNFKAAEGFTLVELLLSMESKLIVQNHKSPPNTR
jgi:hypothetical protein